MSDWKNRIIGHGDEPLDEILFNPANWRIHPKAQQEALEGVLSQVGFVQDVIINKQTGHLVDGHLRCQVAARNGEKTIPAVYVDLTPDEEALILATIDPLSAMAATDKQKLDDLLHAVQSDDARVQEMMSGLAEREGIKDIDPEKWGEAFSGLPDEDRAPFQQMTFTLHDLQAETVKDALTASKGLGDFGDTENENSNGNALARICELFLGEHGRG